MQTSELKNWIKIASQAVNKTAPIDWFRDLQFKDGLITGYNDDIAVRCTTGVELFDGSINAGEIGRYINLAKEGEITCTVAKSGKSKFKVGNSSFSVAIRPADHYQFEWPKYNADDIVSVGASFFEGLKFCDAVVDPKANNLNMAGITLSVSDGVGVLYSTDNKGLCKFELDEDCAAFVRGIEDGEYILSSRFYKTLLGAVGETVGACNVGAEALLFDFDSSIEVLGMLINADPCDFEQVVTSLNEGDLTLNDTPSVPEEFVEMLQRAAFAYRDERSTCAITIDGEVMNITTQSDSAEVVDSTEFIASGYVGTYYIDPYNVLKGARSCDYLAFTDRCTILADDQRMYFVAHKASPREDD